MVDEKIIVNIEADFAAWKKSERLIYDAVEARIAGGEDLQKWLELRKERNQQIAKAVYLAKPFAEWLAAHPLAPNKTPDINEYLGYLKGYRHPMTLGEKLDCEYVRDLKSLRSTMSKEAWHEFMSRRKASLKKPLTNADTSGKSDSTAFESEIRVHRFIICNLHRMSHPAPVPAPGEKPRLGIRAFIET